jgi:hypothetical protein
MQVQAHSITRKKAATRLRCALAQAEALLREKGSFTVDTANNFADSIRSWWANEMMDGGGDR